MKIIYNFPEYIDKTEKTFRWLCLAEFISKNLNFKPVPSKQIVTTNGIGRQIKNPAHLIAIRRGPLKKFIVICLLAS